MAEEYLDIRDIRNFEDIKGVLRKDYVWFVCRLAWGSGGCFHFLEWPFLSLVNYDFIFESWILRTLKLDIRDLKEASISQEIN